MFAASGTAHNGSVGLLLDFAGPCRRTHQMAILREVRLDVRSDASSMRRQHNFNQGELSPVSTSPLLIPAISIYAIVSESLVSVSTNISVRKGILPHDRRNSRHDARTLRHLLRVHMLCINRRLLLWRRSDWAGSWLRRMHILTRRSPLRLCRRSECAVPLAEDTGWVPHRSLLLVRNNWLKTVACWSSRNLRQRSLAVRRLTLHLEA